MSVDRRTVLKAGGATLGAAAFARAIAPITAWTDDRTVEELPQKHYQELTPEEIEAVLRRLEEKTEAEYGRDGGN